MTNIAVVCAERTPVLLVICALSRRICHSTRWAALIVAACCAITSPSMATGATASTSAQPEGALGIAHILERLSSTYAAMSVYIDRGVVTTMHPGESWSEPTQVFTTHFERSKTFTWTSDLGRHDEYGVVFDGIRVVHIWNGTRETMPTIGDAIGRTAGVSHLSSTWVPALLMPDALEASGLRGLFRRSVRSLRLPDETINGRPCFVIASTDDGSELKVWVSKRDFLLRRIEQRFERYNSVTTTDYTPQTDISLAP